MDVYQPGLDNEEICLGNQITPRYFAVVRITILMFEFCKETQTVAGRNAGKYKYSQAP